MSDNAWFTSLLGSQSWSDIPSYVNTELAASRFRTNAHYSSADTLAKNCDTAICDATTAAFSLNLPATPADGDTYTVKKADSSVNAVTVDGNGNNIEGGGTHALSSQYDSVTVTWDATDSLWYILATT